MTEKSKHSNAKTRHGNGAGYGGPAKGAAVDRAESIATHAPFTGVADNPGHKLGERKARMQARAYAVLEAAMEDPDMRVAVTAADKALDRIEGRPMQKIVTPDSAPEWFIEGVPEAETMAEWTAQATLAATRPAGNAD